MTAEKRKGENAELKRSKRVYTNHMYKKPIQQLNKRSKQSKPNRDKTSKPIFFLN
jgi:hypothetical protein